MSLTNQITVSKTTLLAKLEQNYKDYLVKYVEQLTGWRERVQKEARKLANKAKKGTLTDSDVLNFSDEHTQPKDFGSSYSNAIEMLRYAQETEIKLGEREFRQLVLNKWEWEQTFNSNSMKYNSSK